MHVLTKYLRCEIKEKCAKLKKILLIGILPLKLNASLCMKLNLCNQSPTNRFNMSVQLGKQRFHFLCGHYVVDRS